MTQFEAEDFAMHADEIAAIKAACAAGDADHAIMEVIADTFRRGYDEGRSETRYSAPPLESVE